MDIAVIDSEKASKTLSWALCCDAIAAGHRLPRATLSDQFLQTECGTLMSRAATIKGLGSGVKTFTVTPENAMRHLPSVQGAMVVFAEETGSPKAMIDSQLITNWKTAADSVLGAKLLANQSPEELLIVGAGTVAAKLVHAYCDQFPSLTNIAIWSRTHENAAKLANAYNVNGVTIKAAPDLQKACGDADIISCATLAQDPIIFGDWVAPGTHIDLIGAFKADMREADNTLLQKAEIFVDSFNTTIEHIGELKIPLATGAIKRTDIHADLYDLVAKRAGRKCANEITLYKNGGGAHLDLMVATAIIKAIA